MASTFSIRKSIFGRLLALSSTGGIVSAASPGSTSGTHLTDSGVNACAQMWGPGMVQTIGAGATLTKITNYGITYFTTGATAAALYSMDAPVKGVSKTLVFQLASTLITLNSTAATIIYQVSSAALSAAVGSSALAVTSSDGIGTDAILVGLSTTQWQLLSRRSTHVA